MRVLFLLLILASVAALAEPPEIKVSVKPLAQEGHESRPAFIDRALLRAKVYSDKRRARLGLMRPQASDHTVELKWPMRKAITVGDAHIQTIDAFFDHDDAEGPFQDWNCGDRAYDGHNGTDISMKPYPWWRMRRDHGIIMAAAPGTIMFKDDSHPEDSCDFGQKDGNAIVVEHDDGSQAIYAHMRTGSLTQKPVGATVEAGDYLGVVGSSGISTGPHLHFGVGFWEQEGNVQRFVEQDPWAGACNNINLDGWWETTPPYLVPNLMSLSTHDKPPEAAECPGSGKPHFSDTFNSGDSVTYSIVIRDQLAGVKADVVIRQPDGSPFTALQISDPNNDFPGGAQWTVEIALPDNAATGEWKLEASMDNEELSHSFWVNEDPPGPIPINVSNNQFNGLWYDPSLDGEGYNVVTTPFGTVIYFYGSDEQGNRLWMISETIKQRFSAGQAMDIVMYESTGGIFAQPVKSARGLSVWGNLNLEFDDCNGGTAVLHGVDGEKTSAIIKLAGVPGTGCINGDRPDAVQAGLWFNPDLDGEGFNLIVAPNGVVIYYYGFDADGERLWLITSTIKDEDITDGAEHTATLFRADSGTFDAPVPSAQSLVDFGDLTVSVGDCNSMDYEMITDDGNKNTGTVRLAGVLGLDC